VLPEYAAFQYLNRTLSPKAKFIFSLSGEGYHSERDYFHDGGELPDFSLGPSDRQKSRRKLRASSNQTLDHLLVRRAPPEISNDNLMRPSSGYGRCGPSPQNLFSDRGYSV
jgi:hypothetical protein